MKNLWMIACAILLIATSCSDKKGGEKHQPNIAEGATGATENPGVTATPNAQPDEIVELTDQDKKILQSLPATKFLEGTPTDMSKVTKYGSGLIIVTVEEGPGAKPPKGENVNVHYHGQLLNGDKFDSSYDRGSPFSFPLGAGRVIKAWDQGIALLNMGTRALLVCPPSIAYGNSDMGNIPPNSTLLFSVEVMGAF